MSKNDIKALNNESLKQGFLLCHQNAENLMTAGELLFKNGFTPYANSFLLLAVEEEIKAQMIHGIIINPEFSKSLDLEPLFSKHKIKKEIAERLFWYYENLGRFIKTIGIERFIVNPEFHLEWFWSDEFKTNGSVTKNDMQIDNWFKQMATSRESGFYVDFSKNNWLFPSRVKEGHYRDSLEICKMIIGLGDIKMKDLKNWD